MASASTPAPPPLERHRWKIIAFVIVVLAIGARYEPTQAFEAKLIGLGIPVLAGLYGLRSVRGARVELRRWAGLTALLVLLGCEVQLGRAFYPAEAFAEATLSEREPDAELPVPDGTRDLDVETHGNLGKGSRSARESFRYVLERDGVKETVEGTFTKSRAIRVSRRRAPRNTSSHIVDLERQSLSLTGNGPVHAHLEQLSGGGAKHVDIRLRPSPTGAHVLAFGVWIALGLAFGLQLMAARDGTRSKLIAWLGAASALATYLPRHFSPDDPLGAVIGAAFVALVAGFAGWLFGWLGTRVVWPADA